MAQGKACDELLGAGNHEVECHYGPAMNFRHDALAEVFADVAAEIVGDGNVRRECYVPDFCRANSHRLLEQSQRHAGEPPQAEGSQASGHLALKPRLVPRILGCSAMVAEQTVKPVPPVRTPKPS